MRTAVEAAWLRRLLVLTIDELPVGLSLVLGGTAALLLLGTGILSWPGLALLALAGIAVTVWRVHARVLGRYRLAQLLDRRLGLADSLSTAWFLLESADRSGSAVAHLQISRAEELAQHIHVPAALPFVWRRAWAVTGALAALAIGLFAARYLLTSKLSLDQSLLPPRLLPAAELLARAKEALAPHPPPDRRAHSGFLAGLQNEKRPAPDKDHGEKSPEPKPDKSGPSSVNSNEADHSQVPGKDSANSQHGTGQRQAGEQSAKQNENPERNPSRQDTSGKNQDRESGEQHSASLMSKMKDALSGLMEKLKPETPKGQQPGRNSEEQKPGDQASESNRRDGEQAQGNPKDSQQNQGEGRQGSSQTQAQAQATEKSAASQSQVSSESANGKGSDAHSGIGRQDGEKALKEAEQLRAMGKLQEIIGKRSASLTGDMTVETRSTRQQLQTQYSGRIGQHADLGGEVGRDEVPLALQKYVRDYMEQVRKQPEKRQ